MNSKDIEVDKISDTEFKGMIKNDPFPTEHFIEHYELRKSVDVMRDKFNNEIVTEKKNQRKYWK